MDSYLGSSAIRTAFDVFEEQVNRPKLTTGHGDLDSLIGGILPGTFTLLYGEQEILSLLVHKLLANCALPEDKGGFDGEAIYFNYTNYYAAKTILDPSLLGQVAKHVGIDPLIVFKRRRCCLQRREAEDSIEEGCRADRGKQLLDGFLEGIKPLGVALYVLENP